jgi:hypothetical protein
MEWYAYPDHYISVVCLHEGRIGCTYNRPLDLQEDHRRHTQHLQANDCPARQVRCGAGEGNYSSNDSDELALEDNGKGEVAPLSQLYPVRTH